MKTFTNCAEKKAKQFLNLLQGYTKGIRMTALLILLLMGVSNAWAWNYGGSNVYFYFANTGGWPGADLYIWNGDWNTHWTMTQITNTKIYYHKWSSAYNNNAGILFRGAANWNNGQTGDITANYTSHTSWVHNNTTGSADLSNINRQAKVVAMLSTGGNYTATANANCVAKVSGYTVVAGNSSATAKNASTSGSANNASISAAYGSTITYTATAGTGYTFKGFSTSNSTSLPASPAASGKTATASAYGSSNNSTYYAYFKANSYTVKFDANGGTGSMSNQSHTYGVSKALTANAFTRNGYNFAGWNTKADGTGTSYTDKQSVSNLTSTDGGSVTLYAQWELATYNINYTNLNGASHSNPATYNINTETITFAAPTTKPTGYTFVNWTPASIEKGSYGDKTVTANWTAATATVTLNQEEATTQGTASVTATYGSAMPTITIPARTGYTFGGYFTGKEGTGTQYYKIDGTSAKNSDLQEDITLYAKWTINTYTITYNLDGGTNHDNNPTSYTVESETIKLQDPNKTGYRFEGWYTEAGFTNQVTEIAAGSTGNKTFYAKWTENKSTITVTTANTAQGTLKFGSTAKSWGTTASVGVTTTQKITATANKGFKFVKWELSGGAQSSSTLTNATITIKGDGNGTAGTATAVFKEDLSSNYVVRGGAKFGNTWGNDNNKMTKKPGQSTEDIVYFSLNIDATNTGGENDAFHFKIYDTKNQKWWGLHTDNCSSNWWYNRNSGEQTLKNHDTDKDNIQLRADAEGVYEIKVDYSDANNPKITVIFPSSSMSLVGTFNDWNASANPFVIDGNIATATIDLPMGDHEFKINDDNTWRTMTASSKIITRDANQDINFNATTGSNSILKADAGGTYTFIYNKSSQTLTVEYPDIAIRLTGEFNSWNNSDDNYKFTEDPAKPGTYTLTKHFDKRECWQAYGKEQAEYEFKLNINGKSYTVEGDGAAKVLQYTRQNTTKIVNDGTDYTGPYYNLLLQADQNGDYLFTYDSYTRQLTVTHPKYYPEASYIVGDFSDNKPGTDAMPGNGINSDEGHDWTEKFGKPFENGTADCVEFEDGTWNFKIKINGIWYGADLSTITTSGVYILDDEYADTGEKNVTLTTNGEEGCYYFEYTVNPDGTLSVLIIFPNDRRTVTFDMQGHGTPVEEQRVLYNKTAVKPYVSDVDGYLFAGWYTDAACTKEYDFNTPVTKDITLYAKWVPYSECIFFKDNLNWDNIYIYTFSDNVWHNGDNNDDPDDDKGVQPKVNRIEYGKMTQIGYTDIYYYALTNLEGFNHIAFSDHDMHDYDDYFHNHSGIYRSDRSDKMQLFIPQKEQTAKTHNNTEYYSEGIWMKYNDKYSGYDWSGQTGGSSNWSDTQLTSDLAGGYSFTAEVELTANQNYEFKIKNLNNTWYGNTGTMTQDNCTDWWFTENTDNAKITPTVTGTYIFTVYLGDGKVMVSLDYPLSVGDYRLAYLDNTANSFHPGHYLKKRNENKLDTVSFFIHHDKQPQVIAQRCKTINAQGIATWETITSIKVNPAASITESGVYNFTLRQIAGQNDPRLLSQAPSYTGDYYIRTDAAPGGWKSFRQIGNMMTYNSYADEHEDFDHYFCEWVSQEKGLKNVQYTIANDYSYCISDTLKQDVDPGHPLIVTDAKGDLPTNNGTLINANVRWGWDSKTNKIRRAYMAGSGHKKDRFLVLEGNSSLLDINGKRFTGNTAEGQDRYNLTDDEVVFDDMGNWIYQMDVKANKNTKIDLTAKYNNRVQYFKGGSLDGDELPLIVTTDANSNYYKIRLIYDFKINQLIIAWLPEGEADSQELQVNMMIIRHNQEQAQQLNFKAGAQLTGIEKAYAVMTFDKYFLNNKNSQTGAALSQAEEKSDNERKFYWISFPFDVKLSDVSGFGEYGDYWIMEYYDGEARAKEGYWAETETFWKYITNKNYILKAGQGYVLYLNINKMKFESPVFANTSEVSLFFPSLSLPKVISGDLPTAVDVPEHTCTIERDNRNIYDSNWNLIGVPGFADISDVTIGDTHHKELNGELNADCVSFYYKYLPGTNTYSATTQNEKFQTMYAYMVQFAGTINWQAKTMPAQLAARRTGSTPSQYDLRLELAQGEKIDQTFVQLKEADATAEFDMNVDMTKIFNSGMNIYTLTGSNAIQVAGNALPMAKATIPVGVVTATAGEYTFRMPDGTDGIAVTLVDNATGTHTNMLMDEYTVTLDAGTIENRFYLMVDPDRTATSVENIGEEAKGEEAKGQIKKFLIDGKLFIRTADGIFDAKGQRM